ncbi:MAG: hypothetical protein H6739_24380 [Alphaproteobacteria bacterium]|nr:hypothetical protein [Alphaproteobacteria bacterium]
MIWVLLATLWGCDAGNKDDDSASDDSAAEDADGDGVTAAQDCDDHDAAVHPDAQEVCDGVDNDCDGTVDVDAADAVAWFTDEDGDGFGAASAGTACEPPDGAVARGGDCDDLNAAVHPDAEEVCDSVDNDCDGTVDHAPYWSASFESGPGPFTLNGSAEVVDGALVLTQATANQAGSAFHPTPVPAGAFYARFTVEIGGGTGADGMTFAMLADPEPTQLGDDGVGLGVQGLTGWAVEFDTWDNDIRDPDDNHVALVETLDLHNIEVAAETPPLKDAGPIAVELRFEAGVVTVALDGATVLSATVEDYALDALMVGFTAGTGRSHDRHAVTEVEVGCL